MKTYSKPQKLNRDFVKVHNMSFLNNVGAFIKGYTFWHFKYYLPFFLISHPNCVYRVKETLLFLSFLWISLMCFKSWVEHETLSSMGNMGGLLFEGISSHIELSVQDANKNTLFPITATAGGSVCASFCSFCSSNISPSNQWHSDYADCKTRARREVREAQIHLCGRVSAFESCA